MNNIEQIEITLIVTGKKQKKQVSWLITDKADWFNDANPFLITDSKIASKLYGEFSGKPIQVRMLSKYPYLKSRIEDYEDEQIEKDSTAPIRDIEPSETKEAETTNQGGLEEEESIKPQPKKRGRKPNTKK